MINSEVKTIKSISVIIEILNDDLYVKLLNHWKHKQPKQNTACLNDKLIIKTFLDSPFYYDFSLKNPFRIGIDYNIYIINDIDPDIQYTNEPL